MSIVFSTITFFGLIVTAVAAVAWIVGKLRRRETKARIVCIVAAVVTVISFIGFGVTRDPDDFVKEPPPAESTAQDVSPETSTTPDTSAVPSAPEEPATPVTSEPVTPPVSSTQPAAPEPPASEEPVSTEPPATSTPEPPPAEEPPAEEPPAEEPPAEEPPAEEIDPVEQDKQDIEEAARQIIADHYTNTDIDSISVNENYGTEADGDYILLVRVTWNVKNSVKMTKKVLAMYSEDFAARVGEEIENVQEVAVFWTVPYHLEDETAIKYSYARRGSGMYETDCMIMIQE